MSLTTINPSTNELIKTYPLMDKKAVKNHIESLHTAFLKFRRLNFATRADLMRSLAERVLARKDELAKMITTEMGKPISQAEAEVVKSTKAILFYADNAEEFLSPKQIESEFKESFVRYEPIGIIFLIMPWNFPVWQVIRAAIPNLMAGNAVMLSHAPNVTGSALLLQEIFTEVFREYPVFQSMVVDIDTIHQHIITDDRIRGVSLTGSERAGSEVAKTAGIALKKVVLELGGSDPYLILSDADVEHAARMCLTSRLNNCGQVCIAAKRLIIDKSIYHEFKAAILAGIKEYHYSDPMSPNCKLGPLARTDLRDALHRQVEISIDKGATCLAGGEIPNIQGNYYPVTVLENITQAMPAYDDELFGPVISLFAVDGVEEAIALANDTRFGLSAGIFSENIEKAKEVAVQLDTGNVFINKVVTSDTRFPFGGTKRSGIGRELGSEGILEFVNMKMVVAE